MNNVASLSYETLLAYIVPAAIVELIFLPLLYDHLNLRWDTGSAPYIVLGFIGLSILVGLLLHMWGVVVSTSTGWQQKRRNLIWFGKPSKPSVLFEHMEALYPNTSEQEKVNLVYAFFNTYVREHIYARRNYDWYFYQASRNVLAASPFSVVGLVLLAFRDAWSSALIGVVSVAAILILTVLFLFTLKQLEIYYGFYANVVLGHLFEQSAQAVVSGQSLVGTENQPADPH